MLEFSSDSPEYILTTHVTTHLGDFKYLMTMSTKYLPLVHISSVSSI